MATGKTASMERGGTEKKEKDSELSRHIIRLLEMVKTQITGSGRNVNGNKIQ